MSGTNIFRVRCLTWLFTIRLVIGVNAKIVVGVSVRMDCIGVLMFVVLMVTSTARIAVKTIETNPLKLL